MTKPRRGAANGSMKRAIARALALSLTLAIAPLAGLAATPAYAVSAATFDYPSWQDVQNAKKNEAQAKALQAQLEGQIKGMQDEVARAEALAAEAGQKYYEAQLKYDEQVIVTQNLIDQSAQAQAQADAAFQQAAAILSQLVRMGSGNDVTTQLFSNTESPDSLLYRMQTSDLLTQRYDSVYEDAKQLQNVAASKAAEAEVAKQLRDQLQKEAEAAFAEAKAAAEEAAAKLEQLNRDIAEVQARVAYLAGVTQETSAKYQEWLDTLPKGGEGEVSSSGWARPAIGYISSNFGPRFHPIYEVWKLHSGVDLAGQGCGANIRAAAGGTVTYAGKSGDLGNFIEIAHDGGIRTGYAHIMPGGIGVRIGQDVGAGQVIARVGDTGGSTGCHLHFMVRVNGDLTNPVPFMRDRGITLG